MLRKALAQPQIEWDEKTRGTMLWFGIFFVLTFVTSMPSALFLYTPIVDDPAGYVLGGGEDTRISIGIVLEVALVITNAGTALILYPLARKFSETLSIAYVGSRLFESVMIGIGILALLSVLALRQDIGGVGAANPESVATAATALMNVHEATFLLGPAFCAGFGNGILLGYIMWKSRLMPRKLAILGLVGGPLALITAVAVTFGAWEQLSLAGFLFTLVEIVWELTVGFYLAIRAFKLRGKVPAVVTNTPAELTVSASPA